MTAEPQRFTPLPRNLRLFDPEEPGSSGERAHDSVSCVRSPPVPGTGAPITSADPADDDLFARAAEEHRERRRVIPEAERAAAGRLTLPAFWDAWLRVDRERAVERGDVARSTLEKERQILARFAAWELTQRPAWWPADRAWAGMPIARVTGPYLERFLASQLLGCKPATVEPRWFALRTVLNTAVTLKALAEAPAANFAESLRLAGRTDEDDDDVPTSYKPDELVAIYRALPTTELQVAWVLGANAGPRAEDLFSLQWIENVRLDEEPPALIYRAQKTGRKHWIPLAPVTVAQLRRLTAGRLFAAGPVFPQSMGRGPDPGRSRPARNRTAALKAALIAAGLPTTGDYAKPCQVLRATATTRMRDHRRDCGHLLTHGPDADVVGRHYDDYRQRLTEAVMTLPQPDAFRLS